MAKKNEYDAKGGYSVDKVGADGKKAGTPVHFDSAADAHARDKVLNGNKSGMSQSGGEQVENTWAHLSRDDQRRY